MARLGDHPHVVTVYDAVEDRGALHIVARYMAGGSLAARLAAAPGGRLEVAEVLRTGRALADALAHAHEHGVVHRDVKPDNVWLAADGSAGLGDFGIAVAAGDPAAREHRDRHALLPGAGAGRGRGAAAPERPLRARCDALGAAVRAPAVPRPRQRGAARPAPPRRARAAFAPRAGDPGGARRAGAVAARQAAGRPAGSRRRRARRARPAGRRAERPRRRGRPRPRSARRARGGARQRAPRARGGARGQRRRWWRSAVEPGIGKTRIVDEAAAEAGAGGAAVVRGRAGEESRAYGPWREALRPLVAAASGLPARVLDDVRRLTGDARPRRRRGRREADGEEARLRMLDAVAELVRSAARERELFIALEDVHAADRSSLRAARPPAAGGARRRACWWCSPTAARDLGAGHPLGALLESIERDRRLTRVTLLGLPEAAAASFLPADADVTPAMLRELHERTAGNPFFLRELVRLLAERGELAGDGATLPAVVPERVREVVGRRLEPLAAATREVLAIAGVVGRPFTIAGVARVGGLGRESVAEALEPALAGRLVEARADAPGRFGFAHAIVRDAVYDELAPALRARLHAAVAAVLQESLAAGGEATAAEAARHALAAARCGADPQPAWELAREAAREAAGLQAHAEAAAHYAEALEALELGAEATPAERLETTLALAAATFAAGDIEAARRRFRAVARAARRAGAAELQARAALGFSEVQPYGAIDDDAIALLQGALDVLPPARQRAARPRVRAARPAARPRDRPGAPRGARRRGRGDGAPAGRRRRAGLAAVRRGAGQLAARARRGPPRRGRGGDRARDARRRPRSGLVGADDARARRARGRAARRRRRRSSTGSRGWRRTVTGPTTAGGCWCCRRRGRCSPAAWPRASGSPSRRSRSTAATATTPTRSTPCSGWRSRCCAAGRRTLRSTRCATTPRATRRCRCGRRCSRRRSGGCGPSGARRSLAACARDGFAALQRSPGGLCGLTLLAEPVAALGTPEQMAQLARGARAARRTQRRHGQGVGGVRARSRGRSGVLASAAGQPGGGRPPLRAGGRAVRGLARARLGARRDRRLAARRRAGRRARTRSAPGAPRSHAGSASAGPPRAPTLRRRRRSSPAAPARGTPRRRPRSRRRPQSVPQLQRTMKPLDA